jgi:hypothetical protein
MVRRPLGGGHPLAGNGAWIHDHLPYSQLQFFPKLGAFNIGWQELPRREIYSFIHPRGYLTPPGMPNNSGDHAYHYPDFPELLSSSGSGSSTLNSRLSTRRPSASISDTQS